MEETSRGLLQHKHRAEQLKQEKTALTLSYEVSSVKLQALIISSGMRGSGIITFQRWKMCSSPIQLKYDTLLPSRDTLGSSSNENLLSLVTVQLIDAIIHKSLQNFPNKTRGKNKGSTEHLITLKQLKTRTSNTKWNILLVEAALFLLNRLSVRFIPCQRIENSRAKINYRPFESVRLSEDRIIVRSCEVTSRRKIGSH